MRRKKYISQAEINHKKYGAKWKLLKAKKFFKTVIGTDKFVEESPSGVGDTIFKFRNDRIWLEAYVGYGSDRIEFRTVNPHETIGFYNFETFEKDHDRGWKERDRDWEETKKQIKFEIYDWLNTLANKDESRFKEEIRKIQEGKY